MIMLPQRALWAGALVCALVFTDPLIDAAQAGPVEELLQLAAHPSDPDVMVLRYEFGGDGLFITRDGGAQWELVCNSAIAPRKRGGPVAVAADGRVFVGDFLGVWSDDANGCGWSMDSTLADTWVRDLVAHPSDPAVLFAVTSKGDTGALNGVYRYSDGQWSALGSQAEVLISRLLVSETADGLRFYQSAQTKEVREDGSPNYLIRYSDDDGATWMEQPFPATDAKMRLEGVDPTNPDRLLASLVYEDAADKIMLSNDAGASWTDYMEVHRIGGIAFAPDGRVWIGDAGDNGAPDSPRGLWGAANLDTSATQLTDEFQVKCVSYRPADDSLFVCRRFQAGRFDLTDNSLETSFEFTEIESFASCPGVDMVETCRDQLLSAYCGVTHFPCAPVCEPYEVDLSVLSQNGCAFDYEKCIGTGTDDMGNCLQEGPAEEPEPMTNDPEPPATGGSSGSGAGGPRVAEPGMNGDSGNSGSAAADSGEGGCRAAGARPGGASFALFGLLFGYWLRRRR